MAQGLGGIAGRQPVRVIEQDQIDIRGVVELVAAQLAESEGDQAGITLRVFGIGQGQQVAGVEAGEQHAQGGRAGAVGELGETAGHLFGFPQSGDIGEGGGQRDPAPDDAELHPGRRLGQIRGQCGQPGEGGVDAGSGPVAPEPVQIGGFGEKAAAEERVGAEHAVQHGPAGRIVGQPFHEGAVLGCLDPTDGLGPAGELGFDAVGVAGLRPVGGLEFGNHRGRPRCDLPVGCSFDSDSGN